MKLPSETQTRSPVAELEALCAEVRNGPIKPPAPPPPPPPVRDMRSVKEHVSRDELMRWAQANIGIDPERMIEDEIPTPAHASMLQFANDDPARFWTMIAELDKREQAEADSAKAFKDDKRRLFALCDAVLENRERLASETDGG